jgi:metal-responsive CopG/Arc/MetJ family transcriptional regulator
MLEGRAMRTTISIDDDVLMVARGLAERDNTTVSKVISDLARKALEAPQDEPSGEQNGIPLLPVKKGSLPVTIELVNRLRDEMP